jgi:hypothetical protein
MDSAAKRPWYRLHWLTWVVMALVISAIGNRQMEARWSRYPSSYGYIKDIRIGWPTIHLTSTERGSMFPEPGDKPSFTYHWHYSRLVFNLVLCLILTAATGHVLELWLRSPNRMQVTLGSLLGFMSVLAVLAGLASETIEFTIPWFDLRSYGLFIWDDLRRPLQWPILFALGCMLYSLGWLALALLRWAYRLIRW